MKTRAPEIIIERISGPSTWGVEVITRKHKAAQKRVSKTIWLSVNGFFIRKDRNQMNVNNRKKDFLLVVVFIQPLRGNHFYTISLFSLALTFHFLLNNGVNTSDSCNVDNVTDRTFNISKVNRFIQTHLDWADNFCLTHALNELVRSIS